jgi:hypothetical protein
LIIIRALRYLDLLGDEDVIKAIFHRFCLAATDIRNRQGPSRQSLLDLRVLSRMMAEVIEEGIAQPMELVAAEEQVL